MDLETLDFALSDNVATITMNRPDAYNALSHQMSRELHVPMAHMIAFPLRHRAAMDLEIFRHEQILKK